MSKKGKAKPRGRRLGLFQRCENLTKERENGKAVYWCNEERLCVDEELGTCECPEDCEYLKLEADRDG